jgi:hypothetical protein
MAVDVAICCRRPFPMMMMMLALFGLYSFLVGLKNLYLFNNYQQVTTGKI